jgi:inosine-uridine nucleoside N-ribohydrolase
MERRMERIKRVWLDCDPGHDDAMAIILAAYGEPYDDSNDFRTGVSSINLIGVSTVCGNQTVEKTTDNALRMLNIINRNDVPVYRGADKPLTRPKRNCPEIHGESGLDGPDIPAAPRGAHPTPAVVAMAEALLSGDPADKPTLVATGALTNVALLFSVYPEVIDRLSELVIMGGAYQGLGNTGPTAEFNIQCDPEAAHIVFEAGLKSLVMVPLEVTHTVLVTPQIREGFKDSRLFKGLRLRLLLDELMHFFEESYKKVFGFEHPPLHDPVAVFYVMGPHYFKTKRMRVDIDCGQLCAGTTVCDHYGMSGKEPNVTVCTEVDVEAFWKHMLAAVWMADKVSPINNV